MRLRRDVFELQLDATGVIGLSGGENFGVRGVFDVLLFFEWPADDGDVSGGGGLAGGEEGEEGDGSGRTTLTRLASRATLSRRERGRRADAFRCCSGLFL